MRRLIADSGSTKTDWCVCHGQLPVREIRTGGINPFHQSPEEIKGIIREMADELEREREIERIEFYGAGCALPEKQAIVSHALKETFPHCPDIRVESDLMGAARAVCQGKPGIACILGTGSNSCQFDGERIVANTPSLGYILGDEGSGSVLGRTLVSNFLKNQLPPSLSQAFMEQYNLTQTEVLERVYRQPLANRYLAGFTPFLSEHRHEPTVRKMLLECFTLFFQRNVMRYDTSLPVHFVGSIAHFFAPEITEAARECSLTPDRILRAPMEGLCRLS